MGILSELRNKKILGRFKTIAINSVSQLIFPAAGIIISWAVFHYCEYGLWGHFVNILLILNFVPHIMGWGNKDYLLRGFSQNPALAPGIWANSLAVRTMFIPFLIAFLVLFPAANAIKLLVFVWCIARFFYQSYDVVIIYTRKFIYPLLLEGLGLLFMFAYIYQYQKALDVGMLSFAFATIEVIKAVIISGLFYNSFPVISPFKFNLDFFKGAFPFFILGFSGLVQSRTDLLCINYFMPAAQVGHFQVLTTFLLYTQAISGFILTPYIRNIYRMGSSQVSKITIRLFAAGLALVSIAMFCSRAILLLFYHYDPGLWAMVLGGLCALPIFFYLPIIYELYKYNAQNYVLWVNFAGIGVGFVLNIAFITRFSNGIVAALAATALTQWLFIPVYLFIRQRIVVSDSNKIANHD